MKNVDFEVPQPTVSVKIVGTRFVLPPSQCRCAGCGELTAINNIERERADGREGKIKNKKKTGFS